MKTMFKLREKTQVETGVEGIQKKRPGKRGKRIIAVVLVCALVGGGVWYVLRPSQNAAAVGTAAYTTAQVERRNITSEITGSGTLAAANSYSVTSLVEGSILSDTFEEGDQVEQNAVLYVIDSSDSASSLEQAQISLNQAQRNYNTQLQNLEDLSITSPVSGRVYELNVEMGDEVSAGQTVATVRNSDVMNIEVPFPSDDASGFYVGQSATVTLDSTFETLPGTISKISAMDTVLSGNVLVRYVTIDVSNPGGLSTSQNASAAVGTVTSTGSGTFTYQNEETVTAKVSGEVASIAVSEGGQVSAGQTLLTLTSTSVENSVQSAAESLRNAEISLENQYDRLDDYTITSPISGTIVDKNYKAGETAEAGNVLCTIYDLSYLTMTLSVDELDISSIEVGQRVSVTADAVEGKTYEGVVTKVSVAGTSTGSATTYPVTIRIDETDGLLPGMSVDATIQISSAENVLAIPAAALSRGNTVLITADSPSAANGTPVESTQEGESGYVSVAVTIGVSDNDYVEITSGLQEGDVVAYIPTSSSDSGSFMMGGMPGGDMGGAMGGNMGGGPSGAGGRGGF